jgi:hypothetical protein
VTRRVLAVAVVGAVCVAIVCVRCDVGSRGPVSHRSDALRNTERVAIAATATRFVTTCAAQPSTSHCDVLAAPPLVQTLSSAPKLGPTTAVWVTGVVVQDTVPPVALVTATVTADRRTGLVPVAWSLTFTRTTAGWRIAAVTS